MVSGAGGESINGAILADPSVEKEIYTLKNLWWSKGAKMLFSIGTYCEKSAILEVGGLNWQGMFAIVKN
jgi:hypothetical protein